MKYPGHLQKLIQFIKKLPGVGQRSAERFAFDLIEWDDEQLNSLASLLTNISKELPSCELCGAIKEAEKCLYCHSPSRSQEIICVVATTKELFAIEGSSAYRGQYHVLGSLLSPLKGLHPENLTLQKLEQRVIDTEVQEVILALDSTLEGDATALYIKELLEQASKSQTKKIKISRLSFGLPMGSSLDFVDGGTLAHAFLARGFF